MSEIRWKMEHLKKNRDVNRILLLVTTLKSG